MNEVSLLQSLGQVSASETGQVFRAFLRGQVREMICEVMATEVTELCGPKHAPSGSDHDRAGSSSGRVLYEGEREEVVRPRVRQKSSDGTSHEVELSSYRVAKDPQQLQTQIIQAIVSGVSARAIEEIKPKDAAQPFIETIGQEDLTDKENDLEASPLTSDLKVTRPMGGAHIDLSLNKMLTQLDLKQDETSRLSQQ